MIKFLHTSDWHIGHLLNSYSTEYETKCFFDFLKKEAKEKQVDAIIVSGDIFHNARSSEEVVKLFTECVNQFQAELPNTEVIFTAGNHDGLLYIQNVGRYLNLGKNLHAVGVIEMEDIPGAKEGEAQKSIKIEQSVFPIKNAAGNVGAIVIALPYIRSFYDIKDLFSNEEWLCENIEEGKYSLRMGLLIQKYLAKINEHEEWHNLPVILMAHMDLDKLNPDEYVNPKNFNGLSYVALGHIHKKHVIKATDESLPLIYYCGSPIPINFNEINYEHSISLVTIDDNNKVSREDIQVPRAINLIRIPEQGGASRDEVFTCLQELLNEPKPKSEPDLRPYLYIEFNVPAGLDQNAQKQEINSHIAGLRPKIKEHFKFEGHVFSKHLNTQSTQRNVRLTQDDVSNLIPQDMFRKFLEDTSVAMNYEDQDKDLLANAFDEVVKEVEKEEQERANANVDDGSLK